MKASSNSGGWKNLLLQHVEKIVLGVAVLLVGLLLWSAMGVQPIDDSKAPEKLVAAANAEKERIQTSEPPKEPLVPEISFENAIAAALEPVPATHYGHSQMLTPPLQPPIVKRPEPKLFPVEDVRAVATVISIPEIGTPPVWKEEKLDEKPKAAKKEPRPNQRNRPRRRGRGQPGYGDTSDSGYGAPAGRGATAADQPGYGAPAPSSQPGYGAPSGRGGSPGYGAPSGHAGARAEGGSAGGGYGAPVGYGGGGLGMPGAKPGVEVTGVQTQGVVHPAVVLTGRVPYETQFNEYRDKFKGTVPLGAQSAEQDMPKYMQFKVERQEITPAGDGKWVALDLDKAVEKEVRWAAQAQELVDTTYMDQFLTWPLPPTILRDWERLASHPSIPFTWMAEATDQQMIMQPTEQDKEAIKASRFGQVQTQSSYGTYGAASDAGRGGAVGYGAAGALGIEQPMVAYTPYLLFRFVDMDNVVPGKEYRYRVSLELQNPNYGAPPGILEEPASSRQETRWTAPTESSIASVPRNSFLYALDAKNQNKSLGNLEGHVLFHVWNDKMGAEIAKEFDLALGAIADFYETVDDWYNPYTGTGEKLENVHFEFKNGPPMLVDITGGVEVAGHRDLDKPAEMLFMDAEGRMFTSNQARADAAAKFYKDRYVQQVAPDPSAGQMVPDQPGGLVPTPTGNFGGAR